MPPLTPKSIRLGRGLIFLLRQRVDYAVGDASVRHVVDGHRDVFLLAAEVAALAELPRARRYDERHAEMTSVSMYLFGMSLSR